MANCIPEVYPGDRQMSYADVSLDGEKSRQPDTSCSKSVQHWDKDDFVDLSRLPLPFAVDWEAAFWSKRNGQGEAEELGDGQRHQQREGTSSDLKEPASKDNDVQKVHEDS